MVVKYQISASARKRTKVLIDWGLSVETAGTDRKIDEILNSVPIKADSKESAGQSLLVGILRKISGELSKLSEKDIKELINDGFIARQERKRKRLNKGIVTRATFENELLSGGDVFDWLIAHKIIKKININKGIYLGTTELQMNEIINKYPKSYGQIVAILGLSHGEIKKAKPRYFFEKQGIDAWRNL